MKRLFKLLTLAFPILGVALSLIHYSPNFKPAFASATDNVTYGTNAANSGYLSGSEVNSFFSSSRHFSNEYGTFYTGNDDFANVIQANITSSTTIKVEAPFIVPMIMDSMKPYPKVYRYISYEEGGAFNEDIWTEVDTHTDYQLHVNKNSPTLKGKTLGSSELVNIPFTLEPTQVEGNNYAVQNLVFRTTANLYNYEYIEADLHSVSYVTLVDQYDYLPRFNNCDVPLSGDDVKFTFSPSSQGVITGTNVTSLTDAGIWYEGPHESGSRRSYKNKSTIVEYLKDRLINDIIISVYNNITYSSETHFTFSPSETYINSLGNNQVFSSVDPYNESLFTHGGTYDIWIAPIFASSTLDTELIHNISKLVAIPKDNTALLHEIVDAQVEKLVKECSVFDDVHPATPYSSAESVLFNDYQFLKNGTVTNSKVATYKHYSPSSSGVSSYTASASETVNLSSPQSLYTFQYKNINGSYTEYKNTFSANALTSAQWLNQASATGTTTFTNVWNSFFNSGLSANQYVTNSEETSNIVTFKSKDKLFIRVTKDEEDPEILTASSTYGLSTTGYSTLESHQDPIYNFSNPGEYVIELINRSDNSKITKYLSIYDESEIYISQNANNAELNLGINNPTGTSLLDLKIYHSTTKTAYPTSQSKLVEIEPLTPSEIVADNFLLQSKDASDTTISTSTKNYKFATKGCYYVLVTVLNETKAFYVYYNYIPPEPDEIHIDITDQVLDVGEEVNYTITYNCTSGEEPVTKLNYNYETSNSRVSVDKSTSKIVAVSPGVVSVTFTLENELDSVTVNFTVKEPPVPATYTTEPTGKEDLTYTGQAQVLVNPGSSSQGTVVYRIGATGDFSSSLPVGTEAGTYTVQYKILGDSSHLDSDIKTFNVTIAEPEPPEPTPTPEPPTPDPGSSESPSSETPSSESSSSSEVTPTPEDTANSNATAVIIIIAAVGVAIAGTLIFVIIRARRTGRMKK